MCDSEMHTLGYVLFFLWNRALQTCKKPEKTSRLEVSKSDLLGEKVLPSYNTWFGLLVYKTSQPGFPGWIWGNVGNVLELDLSFALAAGPLRPAKALQRLAYALVIFVLSRSLLPCHSVWGGWAQWPLLPSSSGQISQWCAQQEFRQSKTRLLRPQAYSLQGMCGPPPSIEGSLQFSLQGWAALTKPRTLRETSPVAETLHLPSQRAPLLNAPQLTILSVRLCPCRTLTNG